MSIFGHTTTRDRVKYNTGTEEPVEMILNEDHVATGFANFWRKLTGSHLTTAEIEANQFSAQQAELAFDREVEFYEKYQSIGAQVQQMRDAGINPFGAAGVNSGNGVRSASPSSVSPSSGSLGFNPLDFVLGIFNMRNQKRLTDAEVNLKNAEASKLSAETTGINLNNKWIDILNETSVSESRQRISESVSKILNLNADTEVKAAQLGEIAVGIANTQADTEVKVQQLAVMLSQMSKDAKSIEVMDAQITSMAIQAGLSRQQSAIMSQELRSMVHDYNHSVVMDAISEVAYGEKHGTDSKYHGVLQEVRLFLESCLGWFSGTANIQSPQKPAKRIGFK